MTGGMYGAGSLVSEKFFQVKLTRALLPKCSFDMLPEDKTLDFGVVLCLPGRRVYCMNFHCGLFCSRAKPFIEHHCRIE